MTICEKCGKPMIKHHHTYVTDNTEAVVEIIHECP